MLYDTDVSEDFLCNLFFRNVPSTLNIKCSYESVVKESNSQITVLCTVAVRCMGL